MDKAIREQHEQKINYLLSRRKHIEEISGYRVHPDLKLAYSWISDEIKHLKQKIYEQDYLQYEQKLNDVLNIEGTGK